MQAEKFELETTAVVVKFVSVCLCPAMTKTTDTNVHYDSIAYSGGYIMIIKNS